MLQSKAAQLKPFAEKASNEAVKLNGVKETRRADDRLASAVQQSDDDEVVEVKQTEAAKGRRPARKATAKAEEKEVEELEDEDIIPLKQFINGNGKGADKAAAKATAEKKPRTERKRVQMRKKNEAETREVTEDEADTESSGSEEEEEQVEDESAPRIEVNDEGIYEVVSEVDYTEPPEDNVHRSYVGRQHKAEKLIKANLMAKYYRRAPYRIREKVDAQFQGGKWSAYSLTAPGVKHPFSTAHWLTRHLRGP